MKLKYILWPWGRIRVLEDKNKILEMARDIDLKLNRMLLEEIEALKSRERMMARKTQSDVSSNEKLARLTRAQEIALYHATAELEAAQKKIGCPVSGLAIDDIPKPQS